MSAEFTRAFVVGIELYAINDQWNKLSGPVADAHRFVSWLVRHGVKSEHITVFLSEPSRPLADDVPALPSAVQQRKPTQASFHDAIIELADAAPRWFWLYWGGHGVLNDEQHYLLFSDARENSASCLDPDMLWRFLSGVSAKSHPSMTLGPQQRVLEHTLMVLDVCSNYAHKSKLEKVLAPATFGRPNEVVGRSMSKLVASRKGEAAHNSNGEQTGLLSRELRILLPEPASDLVWPPDLAEMDRLLRDRFEILQREGKTKQCPAFYTNETLNGTRGPFRSGFAPNLEPLHVALRAAQPPLAREVVEEAYQIVTFSQDRAVLDAPPGAAFYVATLMLAGRNPPGALLRFVELCRLLLTDPEIDTRVCDWQQQLADTEGLNLADIRRECTTLRHRLRTILATSGVSMLQVVVEPIFGNGDTYQMRAQHRPTGVLNQGPPVDKSQLAQQFQKMFSDARPSGVRRAERIEIALPFQLYTLAVNEWTIVTGRTASHEFKMEPVGQIYPVVIRSYDLAFDSVAYAEPLSLRHSRGTIPLSILPPQAIAGPNTVEAALAGNLDVWKATNLYALAAGNFDPSRPVGADLTLGSELTNSGLPLALWVQKPKLPAQVIQQKLQAQFLDHPPDTWPKQAQLLHQETIGWGGLSLLWDLHDCPLPAAPNRLSHPVHNPSAPLVP